MQIKDFKVDQCLKELTQHRTVVNETNVKLDSFTLF